jgi:hypothetical protein
MRRYAIRVLVLVGICWLGVAGTIFADDRHQEPQENHRNHGHHGHGHHGHHGHRTSAPEIDVGAAGGALTIAAGALALLRERLRRS